MESWPNPFPLVAASATGPINAPVAATRSRIGSTSPLPPCPWCHNAHWQRLSGDYDDDPHPDHPTNPTTDEPLAEGLQGSIGSVNPTAATGARCSQRHRDDHRAWRPARRRPRPQRWRCEQTMTGVAAETLLLGQPVCVFPPTARSRRRPGSERVGRHGRHPQSAHRAPRLAGSMPTSASTAAGFERPAADCPRSLRSRPGEPRSRPARHWPPNITLQQRQTDLGCGGRTASCSACLQPRGLCCYESDRTYVRSLRAFRALRRTELDPLTLLK